MTTRAFGVGGTCCTMVAPWHHASSHLRGGFVESATNASLTSAQLIVRKSCNGPAQGFFCSCDIYKILMPHSEKDIEAVNAEGKLSTSTTVPVSKRTSTVKADSQRGGSAEKTACFFVILAIAHVVRAGRPFFGPQRR